MVLRSGSEELDALDLRARADLLASGLPPLLADAEQLAAGLIAGGHGRRRAGAGHEFWQFRPMQSGDSTAAIDWRRSARGSALFVREREQSLSQTVWLWADSSPSMHWASRADLPAKSQRASLLTLALAVLLLRGGERFGWMGSAGSLRDDGLSGAPPQGGAADGAPPAGDTAPAAVAAPPLVGGDVLTLKRLAGQICGTRTAAAADPFSGGCREPGSAAGSEAAAVSSRFASLFRRAAADSPRHKPVRPVPDLPAAGAAGSGGPIVLISDFLLPVDLLEERLEQWSKGRRRGHLLQVLDPAEENPPWRGRVRFRGLEGEEPLLAGRAETLRDGYLARLQAQRAALAALAQRCGWTFASHSTADSPRLALATLSQQIAPADGRQGWRP